MFRLGSAVLNGPGVVDLSTLILGWSPPGLRRTHQPADGGAGRITWVSLRTARSRMITIAARRTTKQGSPGNRPDERITGGIGTPGGVARHLNLLPIPE